MKLLFSLFCLFLLSNSLLGADSFSVVLDEPENGSFTVEPALPADGRYPAGTIVTVTTVPDPGYVLDSGYYSVPKGRFPTYHESMTPVFEVVVDRDKHIGASFIAETEVNHVEVRQNIVYAQPGKKPLKYDVFTPKGAHGLPLIVIIHGGGWETNDEDVMRGLARELTRGGRFVAASIDYRWGGLKDGDATPNTIPDIIGDCFGAIAHIREHAEAYGADPDRIGITGDSAGGHLAASVSLMTDRIGDGGFGKTPGVFEFLPTYLPEGTTASELRSELMVAIKAGAPSYGVFGEKRLSERVYHPDADAAWVRAVAPLSNVPDAKERAVPQYMVRGSNDRLISDESCIEFMQELVEKGQRVHYMQVGGALHAFYDWKPHPVKKAIFRQYGVFQANGMKSFFESVLYQ